MKPSGFQFKQFFIAHDKCAMKVNTDGILLGSIADIHNANTILDLGTGTGLVAIMLAQRSNAWITALEIEPNAFQQAVENAQNSAFSPRICIQQQDILTFSSEQKFDLIVANPPYFEHSLSAKTAERNLARAVAGSHFAWLKIAAQQLNPLGKISFILPADMAEKLISQSSLLGLYCVEQWQIATKTGKSVKRIVATFSRNQSACQIHQLDIYDHTHQYSAAFKALTQDFYLNF